MPTPLSNDQNIMHLQTVQNSTQAASCDLGSEETVQEALLDCLDSTT